MTNIHDVSCIRDLLKQNITNVSLLHFTVALEFILSLDDVNLFKSIFKELLDGCNHHKLNLTGKVIEKDSINIFKYLSNTATGGENMVISKNNEVIKNYLLVAFKYRSNKILSYLPILYDEIVISGKEIFEAAINYDRYRAEGFKKILSIAIIRINADFDTKISEHIIYRILDNNQFSRQDCHFRSIIKYLANHGCILYKEVSSYLWNDKYICERGCHDCIDLIKYKNPLYPCLNKCKLLLLANKYDKKSFIHETIIPKDIIAHIARLYYENDVFAIVNYHLLSF